MATPDNPYASPEIQSPRSPKCPVIEEPRALPSIQMSLLKWTLACGLAAAPSFYVAFSIIIKKDYAAPCGGMIAGIAAFVILYVMVERTERTQRILAWKFARRTAWIGYGTRIAISVIFPVGMSLDTLCGLISTSLFRTEGYFMGRPPINTLANENAFLDFFHTTIVQGVILNVVLFGYMILVFGICHLIASFKKPDLMPH